VWQLKASESAGVERKEQAAIHVSLAQTYTDTHQFDRAVLHFRHEIECRADTDHEQVYTTITVFFLKYSPIIINGLDTDNELVYTNVTDKYSSYQQTGYAEQNIQEFVCIQ